MRRITIAVALCTTVLWLSGCKKKIACDPADSDASCVIAFDDWTGVDVTAGLKLSELFV